MKSQIASNSKYKITIYHGGEMPEETLYAQTLEEAQRKSMRGEYSEIIDLTTNKMVYGHGGDIAKSNLDMVKSYSKEFIHHGEELQKVLKNDPEVEGWVVAKGERATTDLSDITHYLDGTSEYAKGGTMKKSKVAYIQFYGDFSEDDVDTIYDLLSEQGIEVDARKKWHTKGYAEELQENEYTRNFDVRFHIADAENPKKLMKQLDVITSNSENIDWSLIEEYANGGKLKDYYEKAKQGVTKGYNKSKEYTQKKIHDTKKNIALQVIESTKGKVKNDEKSQLRAAQNLVYRKYAKGGITTNSKQVREAIKQHILENVYDENEEQFKTLDGATQYLAEEFKRVADHRNNLARYPNNQERFTDYLRGIPFNFYFYNDDIEDFLNGLGINPSGKKYTPDQMWKLYGALIWKEVSPKYSRYGQGGEIGSYNNPQNSIHVLHVDGQNWFLSKIDSTHFYISNDANVKGSAQHIGQHEGESYYEEIRQWLKSSKFAEGGEVSKWSVSDITDAEYVGIVEFQDNQGEYHNFEIMETADKLVFGGFTNSGFIESGYIEKDGFSTDQVLQELLEDLEVYYNDGEQYTSMIVVNQRMARGGQMDKGGMIYALAEFVSSGTIANKTNYEKYDDISAIRTKAIQYYIENGDKPYSMGELERVLKMVSSEKLAKGGNVEGLQTEIHNLKRKLVAQAKSKGISENFGQKEVRMLEEKYPMNYSVGQFDEWVQNFDLDSYAKGGKLSNKATYIPKGDIAEVEVEKDGKTTFVDGANLYDGVYVKKGKYAEGGNVKKGDVGNVYVYEFESQNDYEEGDSLKEMAFKDIQDATMFARKEHNQNGRKFVVYNIPTRQYFYIGLKEMKYAKGGMVTKGELVWKKLSSSDKIIFLLENFTPEITPRGQEILVGKSYNFLPKNVKQVLQSKYANVEEFAKGGKLDKKATYGGVKNMKLPKDAKIRINYVDVSVYKDSYEEGETDNVNNYDMNHIKGSIVNPKELVSFLAKNIYTSKDTSYYSILDKNIHTSQLQDADGNEASESEIKQWKKGDLELYSANFVISVSIISEIDFNDEDLTSLTGIGVYKKGGKLSSKANYIPKRDIAEVEVEKDGKTTFVDGANLYDGVYVKKGKFAEGGQVDGFNLVYQTWSKMNGGNGISGTIRTTPQMYYVASIDEKGNISFENLEANTKNIDKAKVQKLWEENKIKNITPQKYYDSRDTFAKGGKVSKSDVESLIDTINKESEANFYLRGAYGNTELWATDKDGGSHRIEIGGNKEIKEALIKNRYNKKFTKYEKGGEVSTYKKANWRFW